MSDLIKCPFVCLYNSFEGCVRDKYSGECPVVNYPHALWVERKDKSEWISVKDKLPEPFESVLVHMPAEKPFPTVHEGYITGNGKWYAAHFPREADEITHWMPLPEPPKGVE